MTRRFQPAPALVNRGVWALAAAVLLAGASLAAFWGLEGVIRSPKPLKLPQIDAAAPPALAALKLPERNPFDPTGAAWRSPAAVAKQAPGMQDVHGVLASRALSGVFTPGGLVKTGEPFAGGTLEAVSRHALTLRMPDGSTRQMPLQLAQKDDKVREQLLEAFAGARAQ